MTTSYLRNILHLMRLHTFKGSEGKFHNEKIQQGQQKYRLHNYVYSRSQWPRSLRRRSLAARLLRMWVRIPPGAWIFVCCERCVLSGRGLCDGLIIRSEESYRMWRVVVCDQETSQARRLKPTRGL